MRAFVEAVLRGSRLGVFGFRVFGVSGLEV